MVLNIILTIVGIINIFVVVKLLIALEKYLSRYKNTLNDASEKNDVVVAKKEIVRKIDKLETILSFDKSCLIGVGGGGGNILSYIQGYDSRHKFIYINSDLQALTSISAEHKIHLQKKNGDNIGCGGEAKCAKDLLDTDTKQKLKYMTKKYKKVYIVASLGGGTGSGATTDIVSYLQNIGKKVYVGVTMPFEFEGKKRMDTAVIALKELNVRVEQLNVFYNNDILKDIKDEGMKETFDKVSQHVYMNFIKKQW